MSPLRRLFYFLFHGTPVPPVNTIENFYYLKYSNTSIISAIQFSNVTIIKTV